MKKLSVTVDDGLYEKSRIVAAQRNTTVGGLVREYLRALTHVDGRRERARREIQKMIGAFGGKVGRMPSRDERNARR